MLPNFLLIGAPKAGTTSLFYFLDQHPEIYMCPVKEAGFFWAYGLDRSRLQGPGLERMRNRVVDDICKYRSLFSKVRGEKAIGEATVLYLSEPRSPELIHTFIPKTRLIVCLRQPADRAFSSYVHNLQDGIEPCHDFREAVWQEKNGRRDKWFENRHLHRGFYSAAIKRYLQYFDREQLHISLFDDLLANPGLLMNGILNFLQVDEEYRIDTSQHHNISGLIENAVLRMIWRRSSVLRATLRRYFSPKLRHDLSSWIMRKSVKPEFPGELRGELIEYYRKDIEELQDLIQRDLSDWLKF